MDEASAEFWKIDDYFPWKNFGTLEKENFCSSIKPGTVMTWNFLKLHCWSFKASASWTMYILDSFLGDNSFEGF